MSVEFSSSLSGGPANVAASAKAGAATGGALGAVMGAANAIASMIPAMLMCIDPISPFPVPFDFNPKEIKFSRKVSNANIASRGPGSGSPTGAQPIVKKSDPTEITINDVLFEGLTCKLRCDTLLSWQSPTGGLKAVAAAAMGMPYESQPPKLLFVWGPPKLGMTYEVRLSSINVTYTRFLPLGIPIRAKVSLNLTQVPSIIGDLATNPTSGGLAGRRAHIVRAGDSLQSIATRYYGSPSYWRPLAKANGLDNPRRMREGQTVYVPNPGELAAAGT